MKTEKNTTISKRKYAQNRRFEEALFGTKKRFFSEFRSRKGFFTEQEVIDAIVESYDGEINEKDVKESINKYVGEEKYGTRHKLRDLSLLRNDTLFVRHVRTEGSDEIKYEIFTGSRDPAIC